MTSRPPSPQDDQPDAPVELLRVDDGPAEAVRRAPFSDKPSVGARGQRTQQRILDAALAVFGTDGYHRCSIERITTQAGCSRASFYQYFSGKDEVFRNLTGQVARQLNASTEALGPLTPDLDGWTAIRAWVARHADIHDRYEPVFHAVQAASEVDEHVAVGSSRFTDRTLGRVRSRLTTEAFAPRPLDPVIMLLLRTVTRTHDMASIMRSAAPGRDDQERVSDALADVIHRVLFGFDANVNVHPPDPDRPERLRFVPVPRDELADTDGAADLTATGQLTLAALIDAGGEVFVRRGYHRTRVDDIVEHAGLSHGAFYRYFENKDQLARVLATDAMRTVAVVLADLPRYGELTGPSGGPALRRWLRRYNATQLDEAAMLRVWVEAALQDATLRANSAPSLDWGRRRMALLLTPRDFGDVDTEGLVLVALLSAFGSTPRTAASVDAAAAIIERGFLGMAGTDR